MDEILFERWQRGEFPFTQPCLACVDLLKVDALRPSLAAVVAVLRRRFGERKLYFLDDWHEHDSFVTRAKLISWDAFDDILRDDKSLYANRHGDDLVRWAYFPSDYTFYFRYFVFDADYDPDRYPGIWGDFDLTGTTDLIDEIVQQLPANTSTQTRIVTAKDYFQ